MTKQKKIIITHNSLQHSPKLYQELINRDYKVILIIPYIYKPNRVLDLINKIFPRLVNKIKEKRKIEENNLKGIKNIIIFELFKIIINLLPLNRYRTEYLQRKLDHLFDLVISWYIIFQSSNSILISYPNVCKKSFKVARRKGIKCILDLPTMHHNSIEQILHEERMRYPNLTDQLRNPINNFNERLNLEMELANLIIIPSTTVKRSFQRYTSLKEKLEIISYGSNFEIRKNNFGNQNFNPVKLIVIGQIQQRKGILYILEAVNKLIKDNLPIQIVFCGNNYLPNHTNNCAENIRFKGFLNRKEIQEELSDTQIILSGSLIEGFSLAIAEAVSQGVVPVVTENCGADFIQNGKNGFVVPIRNSEAIYQKIKLLVENQEILRKFQISLSTCLLDLSWSTYGAKWSKILDK